MTYQSVLTRSMGLKRQKLQAVVQRFGLNQRHHSLREVLLVGQAVSGQSGQQRDAGVSCRVRDGEGEHSNAADYRDADENLASTVVQNF